MQTTPGFGRGKGLLGWCEHLPNSIAPYHQGWELTHRAVEGTEETQVAQGGHAVQSRARASVSPARPRGIRLSHSEES